MGFLSEFYDFLFGAPTPARPVEQWHSQPQPTRVRVAPSPARSAGSKHGVFEIINPEGELQEIDTNAFPFQAPGWRTLLAEYQNGELLLGKVVDVALKYERNELNQKLSDRAGSIAGYQVMFVNHNLGLNTKGKPWLAFLPLSLASFLPETEQLNRYVWATIVAFDKNSMKIVLKEVKQASALTSIEEANRFYRNINLLVEAERLGKEVRGVIRRVIRNKNDEKVGLDVNVEGFPVAMWSSQCMGLLDHDDIELVGLPVGGLLQIKESEQCMNISLRQLYYNKVFHSKNTGSDLHRYPKTGRVVEGISYLVTGNDWLWLLPHNKIGVVRLTEFGVSRRDARDQCGWIGEVRVDAEEPEHDGMSMVRISPLING